MKDMKIGLQLGYWGAGPPPNAVELVQEAERLGFDSVWTAESYGSDALTPLAWWGSRTERVRLGTSLCQLSARTPTAMAMAALTWTISPAVASSWASVSRGPRWSRAGTDSPSRRRWPGPASTSTSCARCWPETAGHQRRAALPAAIPWRHRAGEAPQADRPSAAGRHPHHSGRRRPEERVPGRRDRRRRFPIFFSPKAMSSFEASLDEGFARPTARRTAEDFEVLAFAPTAIADDIDAAADGFRPSLALYIGGWGPRR